MGRAAIAIAVGAALDVIAVWVALGRVWGSASLGLAGLILIAVGSAAVGKAAQ